MNVGCCEVNLVFTHLWYSTSPTFNAIFVRVDPVPVVCRDVAGGIQLVLAAIHVVSCGSAGVERIAIALPRASVRSGISVEVIVGYRDCSQSFGLVCFPGVRK